MRFKRSSRSTRLIASIWPSIVFPRVSMAWYAKSAMFDPSPAACAGRDLHPVGEVDHAHQLIERGRAVEDPAGAVVGQRAKAPRQSGLLQFPAGGAVRDQLVELAVHLQDLDDGHATPIALIVALVAADGAVQRGRPLGLGPEDATFPGARLVGLFAMLAKPAHQTLRDDADDVAGEDVRDDADVEKPRNRAGRRIGVESRIDLVARHRGAG